MKKDDSGYTNFQPPISVVYGAGIPDKPIDKEPDVIVTANKSYTLTGCSSDITLTSISMKDLEHILSILKSMVNPEVVYSEDREEMMNWIIMDSREKSLNLIKYLEENVKGSLGLIAKLGLGGLEIK